MPRPPPLHCRLPSCAFSLTRQRPSPLHVKCSTQAAIRNGYVHRSYAEKSHRHSLREANIPKSLNPFLTWRPSPTHCSGCGIRLQADDPSKPGYLYKKSDADASRRELWTKKKAEQDLVQSTLAEVDESILEKLDNVHAAYKKKDPIGRNVTEHTYEEPPRKQEWTESRGDYAPAKAQRLNVCRRCHELTYHSNPLRGATSSPPAPKSIATIIQQINKDNRDFDNPPLLVHVIDVADFPLSFVPFTVPRGSKLLFVINRADLLCERSSSMGHIRHYFTSQLVPVLNKAGMDSSKVEVHPVSAEKKWGIRELIQRIMQLRNRDSNVYLIGNGPRGPTNIGHTNVGKSSIISAMIDAAGYKKADEIKRNYRIPTPTVSVFPHTTIDNVEIPLNAFQRESGLTTSAKLYDTPGIESDSSYFTDLIIHEYSRATSLLKRGGFQRPAEALHPGQSLVFGGLFRLDLLECSPHPANPQTNHLRITSFTNLPIHTTSTEKAIEIFHQDPSTFRSRKSSIEVCVSQPLGDTLLPALELAIKSTGNSIRNTVEIVFAGMGFIAIGGNFGNAKIQVWTPQGRGVAIRKPIVQNIGGAFSLRPVKGKKNHRTIVLRSNRKLSDEKRDFESPKDTQQNSAAQLIDSQNEQ